MNTSAIDLLKLLGSGVRPDGSASIAAGRPHRFAAQSAGVESLDFAELLQQARSGAISSGRAIEIDPSAGVKLDDAQLTRLARAADAAEAAGASRLLAMIDGQSVVVDVTTRTVTGTLAGATNDGMLTNIDAAVVVGPDGAGGEPGQILPITAPGAPGRALPLGRVENRSLADMLERIQGAFAG